MEQNRTQNLLILIDLSFQSCGGILSFFVAVKSRFSRQLISLVWLLCTIFGSFVFTTASALDRNNGLVYCPLQMQWVAKLETRYIQSKESLSEVCSPDNYKTLFLEKASLFVGAIHLASDTNEPFFTFLTKGERAFQEMPSGPQGSNKPIQVVQITKSGGASGFSNFGSVITQIFSFDGLSRPQTPDSAAKIVSRLPTYSRSSALAITTRGPPSSFK